MVLFFDDEETKRDERRHITAPYGKKQFSLLLKLGTLILLFKIFGYGDFNDGGFSIPIRRRFSDTVFEIPINSYLQSKSWLPFLNQLQMVIFNHRTVFKKAFLKFRILWAGLRSFLGCSRCCNHDQIQIWQALKLLFENKMRKNTLNIIKCLSFYFKWSMISYSNLDVQKWYQIIKRK